MKKIALFLSVALLAAVLVSCGDTDSEPAPTPEGDEASSLGEPVYGGDIVVGISQDLGDSLDPYQMTAAGTREVLFNVYEGLVKPDSSGNFIPAVADSLPTISEDGLVYEFTLRDGVMFHNGAAVTPEDVRYSFETCAATTVDTALAAALSAATVETTDTGVRLTLTEPNGDMLSVISSVFITAADYTENSTAPVGTGPFRFASRSVQHELVLEKAADYWGAPVYLDKITFRIFEDPTALLTALHAGTVDFAPHMTLTQIATLDPAQFQTVEGTMNLVQALYLNHAKAPFDDQKVREALTHAINVEELLMITSDGHGARLGSSIYPAFTTYFDESLINAYPYDAEKAKSLLAEAGYPDGFAMTITVPNNYAPHVSVAEVLAEQLSAVGITATLEQVDWGTWLARVYQGRDFESTVIGFDAVSLTPSALLGRFMSTDESNMITYNNPTYDALMTEAAAELDSTRRTELYREAAAELSRTAANVYLQDLADFVVMKSDMGGYAFYPLYVMDFSTVYRSAAAD